MTEQAPATKASSSSNDSNESEGKPLLTSDLIYGRDGKHLKPLQLTFVQVMLGNLKLLESIMSKSPSEATDYISYLKFLAIKGILAFDQDYDATKSWDNISMGSNMDNLTAQYFHTAVARHPLLPLVLMMDAVLRIRSFVSVGILALTAALVCSLVGSNIFVYTVFNPTKAKLALASLVLTENRTNDFLHAQLMNLEPLHLKTLV